VTTTARTTGPGSKGGTQTVTVVMGTFNGERYITEQLTTVVEQTLPPDEIIVCDDGSTDGTLERVEHLRRSSPVPIRIVRNERRLGFSDNFLTGATMATSHHVAFCDQDDRWYPHKLATALGAMVENDAVLSAHAVDLMDGRGEVVSRHSQGIDEEHVVEPLSGDPWLNYFGFTLVFRRALLDVIAFGHRGESTYSFGAPLSHDRWVCALAHSLGRVVLLDEPLAAYRQHDAQLFGARDRQGTPVSRLAGGVAHARHKLAALHREQETFTRACRHRAALFASAQPSPDFDRGRLDRASAYWSSVGDRHTARLSVHQARPLGAGVRALSAGLRQGIYSGENFGRRAFLKDLAASVLGSSAPRPTE
jgi:hypothetical protein